jgi:hypothetical protein
VHRDTVSVFIPCDSSCTGTKFLSASFSNLCEQRRHFSSPSLDIVPAPGLRFSVSVGVVHTQTLLLGFALAMACAQGLLVLVASQYFVRAQGRLFLSASLTLRMPGTHLGESLDTAGLEGRRVLEVFLYIVPAQGSRFLGGSLDTAYAQARRFLSVRRYCA